MKNILYYDTITETVKTAQHVAFDESMNDLDIKPPNARLLDAIRHGDTEALLEYDVPVPDLDVSPRPFTDIQTFTMKLDADSDLPLGMDFATCPRLMRAYVRSFSNLPVGVRMKRFRSRFVGAYIVSVDGCPVFSIDDIHDVISKFGSSDAAPATVHVELAMERKADHSSRLTPLHLRMHDLQHVCALQSVAGEGMTYDEYRSVLEEFASDLTPMEMTMVMNRLQANGMTDEEQQLKHFTRSKLMKLQNWKVWDDAFDEQLDNHATSGALGTPIRRRDAIGVRGKPPNILRIHWQNVVKADGTRKCRSCMDGSKRAAPWLRQFVQTYASCIEQPCMRLFFALSAALGLTVVFADTKNAYQQSPPPSVPCYLEIDDAYCSWYRKRFGKDIDPKEYVIPVNRALQGHPEAGVLWEKMIVGILTSAELGFTSTTHEKNLYRGEIDGELVLVCRQVDDFAIASKSRAAADKLIATINSHVTTDNMGIGARDDAGVHARYNGVDIHQTADYNKMSCETYIKRVLQTHGWEVPGAKESDRHDIVPMSAETCKLLWTKTGPLEGTKEHRDLEKKVGYSYRQILGEIIYAYVICRLDIGYAATFLSRFSQAPAEEHYKALKDVVKYLRRTKDWGIVYWRQQPDESLPRVPLPEPPTDPSLPTFPVHEPLQLIGYLDAAHATDPATRRSITGYVFTLAGGAIAFKSKLQPTVATSSTEAEFIAAVSAAKVAKYLRSVLRQLRIEQVKPTPLYVDNQAAIAMVNENKPTPRSRHVDIQHFAIQEWRAAGEVELHHIPGTINPSDQATKALGWTLHSRHARRSMGHHRPY
jgi:hypothetical protein